MQYLVLSQRHTDQFTDADFAEHLPAETATVREMYATGVLRQIWLRDDTRGAAFILEADSPDAAQRVVDSLPLAQRGMSEFRVIPLKPYPGFGPERSSSPATRSPGPAPTGSTDVAV